eukprot:3217445-Alexandrium_andersonii.AAC.1
MKAGLDLEKAIREKADGVATLLQAKHAGDEKVDPKALIQESLTALLDAVRTQATEAVQAAADREKRDAERDSERRSRSPHRGSG